MNRRDAIVSMAAAVAWTSAQAQADWPARPIRIVVPSAAGGAADFLARTFGRHFTQATGQPAVVDNRPGGAAVIGAMAVKNALPDGYTFLLSGMSTQAANAVLYRNLPYDPQKDFDEIGMFGIFPMVGLARRDGPLRSVGDLVAQARARPGRLTFGHHAASALVPVELIKARAGVDMTPVPYKSVTQIVVDIAAGVIDFAFIDALSAAPALQNAKFVPIAVTTARRFHALPDVPTVAETLPGYSMDGWLGLSAPAGTPKPVLDRMNALLRECLSLASSKADLEKQGIVPTALGLEEQRAWVAADRKRWVEWMGIAHIQPQTL